KSNIGHTQAAAGVAGVMKMVLAMRGGLMPRTLFADTPSTHVDWSAGAVELLSEAREWPREDRPRRAGVSAFGVSGTNAHVIVEEAPALAEPAAAAVEVGLPVVPWVVSARSEEGLTAQAARMAAGVVERDAVDVGWSLATTRAALEHRAVVLGTDADELRTRLEALGAGQATPGMVSGVIGTGLTGFVFSGQGGQRVGMGRELAEAFPVFAAASDEVCAQLDGLREVMLGDAEALRDTGRAQPALFAFEVASYRLLESWGVTPDYLVGHSVGELAAAHVAGVLSLPDACRLVSARARLMQALPSGGAMWAVRATLDEVTPLLVEGVSVAVVNAPGQVVLSGSREAVETVASALSGRQGRWLEVSHAFHSALMDPMLGEFAAAAAGLTYARPRIPVVSTLTGELVERFDARYWSDQVRGTVAFSDAITHLTSLGVTRFVELGPDASLIGAIGETYDDAVAVPLAHRERPESTTAVTALARLWSDGADVDWAAFFAGTGARTTELPTYAFQHRRHWLDGATGPLYAGAVGVDPVKHPVLSAVVELSDGGGHVFTGRISARTHSWLAEHQVAGEAVFPGTGYVELAIRAGDELACDRVEELVLESPLVLPEQQAVQVQVLVDPADEAGSRSFRISSRTEGDPEWTRHASGVLGVVSGQRSTGLTAWPPAGATRIDIDGHYPARAERGFVYGEIYQGLSAVWHRDGELFAEVALSDEFRGEADRFGLHPAVLDAALQALSYDVRAAGAARLPFVWSGVTLHATGASMLRAAITPGPAEGTYAVTVADTTGELVLTCDALTLRPYDGTPLSTAAGADTHAGSDTEASADGAGTDTLPTAEGDTRTDRRPARRKAAAAVSGGGQALRDRVSALPSDEQRGALLEIVRRRAAIVLDQPAAQAMNEDLAFRDLGFTSLTAVQLREALGEETGLRLPATLVFDYPTPRALVNHLR
ncbi:MAG: polyketide synthase type, partial [Streptosporangiaceae bacterium]|nr:polyketide synthase type [Streptosporangiaceae bacterium]